MQNVNRKSSLLSLMQTEHAQLETLLITLSEEQFLQTGTTGSWSVKDVLAHLTWWEQAMISEIKDGVELDPGLNGEAWSTERANTLVVDAQRHIPLSETLAAFRTSYQQILELVEGLTEAELANDEMYNHLVNNTGNHYTEHRHWIEAGLTQGGSVTSQ